jgi:hypothetical protein
VTAAGHRTLRLWLAAGVILAALGAGLAGWANAKDSAPNITEFEAEGGVILFGCSIFGCIDRFDPRPWYAAGGALVALAAVSLAVAVRRR